MVRWTWAVGVSVLAVLAAVSLMPAADARKYRGDLTEPSGGAPFGGDVAGSYRISVRGGDVSVTAWLDRSPDSGEVFEGWFVDTQTGYKLSLGALAASEGDDDGSSSVLRFRQSMVNPFTYGVLVITAEPRGDLDPNPAVPVAGALLPSPFGQ